MARAAGKKGFALVVVLMLLTLLSVLAIGLLSLANVSLRGSSMSEARRTAQANARLALSLALGQMQSELGDDRRVTADASLLSVTSAQPQLVGVWNSAAGSQTSNVTSAAPAYDAWKRDRFRTWLASSPDPDALKTRDFASRPLSPGDPRLFSKERDGFEMRAACIPVADQTGGSSSMAWAVTQEGTKARINLGNDSQRTASNDAIQAPDGPNLALSDLALQPSKGWSQRSARVLGIQQAVLDQDFNLAKNKVVQLGREHTAVARGVLADVVKGGLKTDLSLGFELDDNSFRQPRWDKVVNPFGGGNAPQGEVPLFQPLNGGTPVKVTMNYRSVTYDHIFESGSAPTFQSLRSYHNLYKYLYDSGGPTASYRPQASSYWGDPLATRGSETSVAPVLDRILFFVCLSVDSSGYLNTVFTPVITLWNPYNVAVESEGFVVFPWMDIPIFETFSVNGQALPQVPLSYHMGKDSTGAREGRQKEPYFYCNLTGDGTKSLKTPIRIGPGEVRVFVPSSKSVVRYDRFPDEKNRTSIYMKPAVTAEDLALGGGIGVPMNISMGEPITRQISRTDQVKVKIDLRFDGFHYFVRAEDAGRMKNLVRGKTLSEVQIHSGKIAQQTLESPSYPGAALKAKPQPVALLETYHRTAGEAGQVADLVYTVNPRQRYVNGMLSGSQNFAAGPHYESTMHAVSDFISTAFQVTGDGQRSYYGMSNTSGSGRDHLSFFEIPREPMLSLGAFQGADLADSAFTPGSQFGNAWASGFVANSKVVNHLRTAPINGEKIEPNGVGLYDSSYLVNAALWDGFFFSSLGPRTEPTSSPPGTRGSAQAYDRPLAPVKQSLGDVLKEWVTDPEDHPLRNPRHLLYRGGLTNEQILNRLNSPAGCRWAAAHLLVDGAFNVNSVNEAAWRAMLSSLRGSTLDVTGKGPYYSDDSTPVPRLRHPAGSPGDLWNGFRELSDAEIRVLATEIVKEVRDRGPFQSLGEFVNRRLSSGKVGLKGALQAAIDRAKLNSQATVERFSRDGYPFQANIPEPYTGIGTPGWLTQADLLTALGPFITVRSDTFTIRAYGEAKDANGKLLARAWCEAVVQRVPDLLDPDPNDNATEQPLDLTPINARFGRRFEIVSFRDLQEDELGA
ncbi:hypothetical protein [Haloferula sp. BvORR071]|uniref:hypothetical protein n=1 Tax=Haloferula sp. BvORR071 TaxID=1396141 RepID=UPI0005507F68|nr:hypothetical protein [Haloferula sp. BvORR071]